jgi:hypothetical protein
MLSICYGSGHDKYQWVGSSPKYENDWENTLYGKAHEDTPNYIPEPLGQHVKLSVYVDAKFLTL